MFVCRAISEMIPTLSAIRFIASTALSTTSLPEAASLAAWVAMPSVAMALSAFCLIVATISSTEAETSSALAACSVEPWLMPWAASLMLSLPCETLWAELWTSPTTRLRFSTIRSKAPASSPISSPRLRNSSWMGWLKSPSARYPAYRTLASMGELMERERR